MSASLGKVPYSIESKFNNSHRYYKITPKYDRKYRLESTGTLDTKVYIYNASGTLCANNNDSGEGTNFKLDYTMIAGKTYYIKTICKTKGSYQFNIVAMYNIKYNANGGSGAPDTQTKFSGTNITLSTVKPTRNGYTFLGWAKKASATSATYTPGASFDVDDNVTLYAVWKANSYIVSFDANGGYCNTTQKKVTYDLELGTLPTPTRNGYSFDGWYTAKIDGKKITSSSKYKKESNGVLYARWIANSYTVSFDANGGTCSTAQRSVTFDSSYGTLPVPVRSGYTFAGWYTAKSGGSKISDTTKYTTAGNVTLYAHWTQNHAHSYTSKITKAPTCTQAGVKTYTCSCGASYTQEIPAKGHTESHWITSVYPSAAGEGYAYTKCENCGLVLDEKVYEQSKCSAPDLYGIDNTEDGVVIEWLDEYGADSYVVYRKTYNAKTKKWSGWSKLDDEVLATQYVDRTAKSGTYYLYTVRAENEAGLSGYDTNGIKTYFLATPKVTSTANTNNAITVKWGKVTGATGYIVYRKTTGGWTNMGKITGTSFTDKTAKSGVTYRYTVRAYYGSYLSSFVSNGYAVRRLTTPTLKSVSSAKAGVTVKWGEVTGVPATSFTAKQVTEAGRISEKQQALPLRIKPQRRV